MFDEIKELKSLLDEGLITQEEFDERKAKILGNPAAPAAGEEFGGAGAAVKPSKTDHQKIAKKFAPYLFFGAGALCLLVGLLFPMPGEDLTTYSFKGSEYFHIEEYVGGDAYNYIIGACILGGHVSGAMTAKAVFAVGGLVLICMGIAALAFFGTGVEKTEDTDGAKMKVDAAVSGNGIEAEDA